ncbi:MAG: thioredoxin domain-containing protein [Alphaproteobacteria bacterium]|nr:thioredoxin domain-containing protein [Alphaproteobacteria bacterium]
MSANLLDQETSPYLLQHKDNPVHWRAWGPDALAEAKDQNKPILLSVGYAACHWCHVMAHESFENQQIAEQMNALFINIKVDREERPDIDTIYQSALSMLGQQGGWPLTMFLTPQGEPFWGGTYFPPFEKWGRAGFSEVLTAISKTYHDAPDRIEQNVAALKEGLTKLASPKSGEMIDQETADGVALRLLEAMDTVHGGIGDAPKFPQPSLLRQLWAAGERSPNGTAFKDAVLFTMRKMCEGGIYDHLGGGFARYTVDRAWLIPHFEKMLYDNAQLLDLLCLYWLETGDPLYKRRVEETITWLRTDMTTQEGSFAAARDADSEGVEGKFYVWEEAEIDSLLGADSAFFKQVYDVQPEGNWEKKTILNRLPLPQPVTEAEEARLAPLRAILFAEREKRVPPLKDDKVLTDWNGMTIAAFANAGAVFNQPDWIKAAQRAFDFVAGPMSDGARLRHSFRSGRARHIATLDDYAAMMRAALVLLEVTGEERYLHHAQKWAEILDIHYRDTNEGAYFLTPDDAEALIARTKSAGDNATPSGNGILVSVLTKLYWLTGKELYAHRAEEIITTFSGEVERNFFPYSTLIDGAMLLQSGVQIILVGTHGDPNLQTLIDTARQIPLAERLISVISPDAVLPSHHPAYGKSLVEGKPAAYICVGPVCSLPLITSESLKAHLQSLVV